MKILVIAAGSYISGAEKVTLDVVKGLKENGFNIHCMVSGWNDGDFIAELEKIKIPYTFIKLGWYYRSNLKWSLDSFLNYPKAIWDFMKLKKRFKADFVYTISFRPIILLYPFFTQNILYHIHDPNSESKQSIFFLNRIKSKIVRFIAVSNFIKHDLIGCGINPDKIEVVHNGVNVDTNLNEKIFMPNGVLRIGIIGQIIPRKGHEDLLNALSIIRGKFQFKCLIFGAGDKHYIKQLTELIERNGLGDFVEWKGYVKYKTEIYENIDVLVAPTRNNEPFALVALEAGAHKVVSVVTNSGGFSESIVDSQTGFIVPKNNPDAIAEKLTFLFNNELLLKQMGNFAYKNISENFLLTVSVEKVLQLFYKT